MSMLFSSHPHSVYSKAPVHEVICQLRFPTILSINTAEPAAFQEEIRSSFPNYSARQEKPNKPELPVVINHVFISGDNRWKINLTKDFLALSTLQYHNWDEFASQLDLVLAAFIRIYKPAEFVRVGLRYVNLVSREKLGVEVYGWEDLIAPAYLGPIGFADVRPDQVLGMNNSFTLSLSNSCMAKITSGVIKIKDPRAGAMAQPPRFLFDMDLSMTSKTPCNLCAPALETLHGHATPLFEGLLTDTLRNAME